MLAVVTALAALAASNLPALSDEFNDPFSLAHWQVLEGDLADGVHPTYSVGGGQLTIVPGRSWWVDATRAFYLYKLVDGDFKATMLVNVTGEEASAPTANWSLSGILVREATDDRANENWVSFRSGAVGESPTFERKTTRSSRSQLVLDRATPGWVQLRVVRLRDRFVLLRRYPGRAWKLHWIYTRPDLPAQLQVGIDAFSGDMDTKADLVSHVDYFRFAGTGVPAKLERRYLAGRVSITKLLPYLKR